MGFLTTITIRNDGLGDIENNQEEFMKNLLSAINADEGECEISCGNHANVAIVQKSRHADDWAIYVHAGNTLTHVSAWDNKTEKLSKICPEFLKGLIDYIINQGKALKLKFKK
jgi:hypothetical protein